MSEILFILFIRVNTQCKYVRFSPKSLFTSAIPEQVDVTLKETNKTCKNNINIKDQDQGNAAGSSLHLTMLKKVTLKRGWFPLDPLGPGPQPTLTFRHQKKFNVCTGYNSTYMENNVCNNK